MSVIEKLDHKAKGVDVTTLPGLGGVLRPAEVANVFIGYDPREAR